MSAKRVGRARLVALGVALALTVAVLRYTVFLNLVAYRIDLAQRIPTENFGAATMAREFHHSGGSCLRYPDPSPLGAGEVKLTVDEIFAARLDGSIGRLDGFFLRWAEEDERAHHGLDQQDEFLAQMKRNAGLFDQAILGVNGRRMHDETHADAEAARLQLEARASEAQQQLDPTQRGAIRPLWERHKLALTVPGLLRVTREIRRRTQPASAERR